MQDIDADSQAESLSEIDDLRQENTRLLDDLELIYSQFLALKSETDVSYAQLRDRNAALERKVRELQQAYAELEAAKDQLIHSERLAAMGQLAASIVHELNNPLMVVIGYVDLVLNQPDPWDAESRQHLQVARKQADAVTHLVQDILSFSRRQDTPFGQIDINECILSVTSFLSHILRRKIGSVPLALDPQLPRAHGDAQQIQQVFANILTNAADAMTSRGSVQVITECVAPDTLLQACRQSGVVLAMTGDQLQKISREHRRFIRIIFRDDGAGMTPEVMEHVFNPFFTTKRVGEGTGLGLSICRTIIERHRGLIAVASVPGAGTAFSIYLPVPQS